MIKSLDLQEIHFTTFLFQVSVRIVRFPELMNKVLNGQAIIYHFTPNTDTFFKGGKSEKEQKWKLLLKMLKWDEMQNVGAIGKGARAENSKI